MNDGGELSGEIHALFENYAGHCAPSLWLGVVFKPLKGANLTLKVYTLRV
jgi:hypothetical protein